MHLTSILTRLHQAASPQDRATLTRFFKTGPGEYAEGDQFLGVRTPAIRQLVKQSDPLTGIEVRELVRSPWHEERMLGLLIWVRRFQRGTELEQEKIYRLYVEHLPFINNWDLVDVTAAHVVGAWLHARSRQPLHRFVQSTHLWTRRIAIVSTHAFIRLNDYGETLELAEKLLADRHDLMHKATGWMLREVGKRHQTKLLDFIDEHLPKMPRTMLRYALECLPTDQAQAYLRKKKC